MIQAITWASVPTSGAGMSLSGPMKDRDLGGEPAGQPLQLGGAQSLGVEDDAALGAAEGEFDDSAHFQVIRMARARALVEVDVGVVAEAALDRAAGDVVLDAVAGEHA